MKILCSNNKLHEGLKMVGSVVTTSTTKPILQAIKLETVGDKLELSATDLEVGLRYLIELKEVVEPGKVVLPGNRLLGLFQEWAEGEVSIETEANSCRISGGGSNFKLMGHDPEEFPTIPTFIDTEQKYFEIEPKKIQEMVRKTAFACASERLRHTMTGVLLTVKGEAAKMVATDGRRMAYMKEKVSNKGGLSSTSIIPLKGIQQLPKIAGQSSTPVKVRLEETHMLAKTEDAMLYSQLIEGQYPNYEEAIPAEAGEKLELDAELFASAVRRAAFLTTEEKHVVKIRLQKNKMTVCAQTPDIGEGEIGIDVNYQGREMSNPNMYMPTIFRSNPKN